MADSNSSLDRCFVIMLTPPGRAAVASVRIEGPPALQIATNFFRPASGRSLTVAKLGRILFGRWGREEVVVSRRDAGAVEVHCHGGQAAIERIIHDLQSCGCQSIPWQQWLSTQTQDAVQVEAHIALTQVKTERTAAILLDQYHGALSRATDEVLRLLEADKLDDASLLLQTMLERSPLGLHLTAPWRVVLAGRPNVGKSSLINALVGYERAIVFDQPGTTRDVVTAVTAIDGWPVELADTAGLREQGKELERAGIQRAQAQIAAADVLLLLIDRSQSWTEAESYWMEQFTSALPVLSKCDLPPALGEHPRGLETSAATGLGIEELMASIVKRLIPNPPKPGGAVPFNSRQVECLADALQAVKAGDLKQAISCLQRLRSDL